MARLLLPLLLNRSRGFFASRRRGFGSQTFQPCPCFIADHSENPFQLLAGKLRAVRAGGNPLLCGTCPDLTALTELPPERAVLTSSALDLFREHRERIRTPLKSRLATQLVIMVLRGDECRAAPAVQATECDPLRFHPTAPFARFLAHSTGRADVHSAGAADSIRPMAAGATGPCSAKYSASASEIKNPLS